MNKYKVTLRRDPVMCLLTSRWNVSFNLVACTGSSLVLGHYSFFIRMGLCEPST